MWSFSSAFFLLVFLSGYFFAFPLSKKRPVVIKGGGLTVYCFVFALFFFRFSGVWTLLVATMVMLYLYVLKPWFVYGATRVMIFEALEKAALATRTSIEKAADGYTIDSSMVVRQYSLTKRIILLSLRSASVSRKAKLTKIIFKKFIQNYFI